MAAIGEDSFVVPDRSNAEEAPDMLTDPNYLDYAALDDPAHLRPMEANRK